MKKLFILILALLVVLSLAACGDEGGKKTELTKDTRKVQA